MVADRMGVNRGIETRRDRIGARLNPMFGAQVFIQFPAGIGQGEMPPLFILGAANGAELVNYRVRDATMVVDRLFAAAELRLGADPQIRVRIVRDDAAAPPARRGARR